jgi:hypothetical protein
MLVIKAFERYMHTFVPSPASSCVMAAPVPSVAVIGGGPVGLWFAIQLNALLAPSAMVRMHEKRDTFERTEALRISDLAFKQCSNMTAVTASLAVQ